MASLVSRVNLQLLYTYYNFDESSRHVHSFEMTFLSGRNIQHVVLAGLELLPDEESSDDIAGALTTRPAWQSKPFHCYNSRGFVCKWNRTNKCNITLDLLKHFQIPVNNRKPSRRDGNKSMFTEAQVGSCVWSRSSRIHDCLRSVMIYDFFYTANVHPLLFMTLE